MFGFTKDKRLGKVIEIRKMLEREKLEDEIIGIYCIENKINNKRYIGQSINVRTRWWTHTWELRNNKHCNRFLQNAWNKHGEDNFKFYLLERCTLENIDEREIYWIQYYDTCNNNKGYNLSSGGDCSNRGVTYTQEQKDYMSQVKNPDEVVQIDFNGNVVRIWRSATHAQRTLGNIRARSILQCCRHIVYQANGYIWFYRDEYEQIDFDVKKHMFEHKRYFDIPIMQYDLYGNLIKIWSQKELKQTYENGQFSVILKVCDHKKRTYEGFIWVYEYENFDLTDDYLLHCRRHCGKYYVDQFDMNMNYVKTWSSEELLHDDYFDVYSINAVCDGKQEHHKNYKWKEYIPTLQEELAS